MLKRNRTVPDVNLCGRSKQTQDKSVGTTRDHGGYVMLVVLVGARWGVWRSISSEGGDRGSSAGEDVAFKLMQQEQRAHSVAGGGGGRGRGVVFGIG